MIPLFDLHSDTLSEAYSKGITPYSPLLQASLSKISTISPYIQVGAIWSDRRFDQEECYRRYKRIIEFAKSQGIAGIVNRTDLEKGGYIFAIEDARLIGDDIERLKIFKDDGVRVLTLTWKDVSIIGGGWNTDIGLTELGKNVINRCFELSILPDVSHLSYKGFYDALEIANAYNKPLIASHSNSFSVCAHKRNFTDEQFKEIKSLNGLVGINLVPQHLHLNGNAEIFTVLKHIYHFLSIGGNDILCLGCDLDGTDALPKGIADISDLNKLYSEAEKHFGENIAKKIFYKNAYAFFIKNLI